MAYEKEKAVAALSAFQDFTGLKDDPWEKASDVGEGTLRRFRTGPTRSLRSETYEKLATGATKLTGQNFTAAQLRGDAPLEHSPATVLPESDSEPPPSNIALAPEAPGVPVRQDMPKDVPVYGTVAGGETGNLFDFELNGQIVDYVRRPPRLIGRTDVFAAYLRGDSVSPWREPGQLVYFERAKAPRVMDYVLVELKAPDGDGVRPVLVKRLLGVTPTKIRLRQYNPPKDFDIERRRVLQIVRALDWDEMLGV